MSHTFKERIKSIFKTKKQKKRKNLSENAPYVSEESQDEDYPDISHRVACSFANSTQIKSTSKCLNHLRFVEIPSLGDIKIDEEIDISLHQTSSASLDVAGLSPLGDVQNKAIVEEISEKSVPTLKNTLNPEIDPKTIDESPEYVVDNVDEPVEANKLEPNVKTGKKKRKKKGKTLTLGGTSQDSTSSQPDNITQPSGEHMRNDDGGDPLIHNKPILTTTNFSSINSAQTLEYTSDGLSVISYPVGTNADNHPIEINIEILNTQTLGVTGQDSTTGQVDTSTDDQKNKSPIDTNDLPSNGESLQNELGGSSVIQNEQILSTTKEDDPGHTEQSMEHIGDSSSVSNDSAKQCPDDCSSVCTCNQHVLNEEHYDAFVSKEQVLNEPIDDALVSKEQVLIETGDAVVVCKEQILNLADDVVSLSTEKLNEAIDDAIVSNEQVPTFCIETIPVHCVDDSATSSNMYVPKELDDTKKTPINYDTLRDVQTTSHEPNIKQFLSNTPEDVLPSTDESINQSEDASLHSSEHIPSQFKDPQIKLKLNDDKSPLNQLGNNPFCYTNFDEVQSQLLDQLDDARSSRNELVNDSCHFPLHYVHKQQSLYEADQYQRLLLSKQQVFNNATGHTSLSEEQLDDVSNALSLYKDSIKDEMDNDSEVSEKNTLNKLDIKLSSEEQIPDAAPVSTELSKEHVLNEVDDDAPVSTKDHEVVNEVHNVAAVSTDHRLNEMDDTLLPSQEQILNTVDNASSVSNDPEDSKDGDYISLSEEQALNEVNCAFHSNEKPPTEVIEYESNSKMHTLSEVGDYWSFSKEQVLIDETSNPLIHNDQLLKKEDDDHSVPEEQEQIKVEDLPALPDEHINEALDRTSDSTSLSQELVVNETDDYRLLYKDQVLNNVVDESSLSKQQIHDQAGNGPAIPKEQLSEEVADNTSVSNEQVFDGVDEYPSLSKDQTVQEVDDDNTLSNEQVLKCEGELIHKEQKINEGDNDLSLNKLKTNAKTGKRKRKKKGKSQRLGGTSRDSTTSQPDNITQHSVLQEVDHSTLVSNAQVNMDDDSYVQNNQDLPEGDAHMSQKVLNNVDNDNQSLSIQQVLEVAEKYTPDLNEVDDALSLSEEQTPNKLDNDLLHPRDQVLHAIGDYKPLSQDSVFNESDDDPSLNRERVCLLEEASEYTFVSNEQASISKDQVVQEVEKVLNETDEDHSLSKDQVLNETANEQVLNDVDDNQYFYREVLNFVGNDPPFSKQQILNERASDSSFCKEQALDDGPSFSKLQVRVELSDSSSLSKEPVNKLDDDPSVSIDQIVNDVDPLSSSTQVQDDVADDLSLQMNDYSSFLKVGDGVSLSEEQIVNNIGGDISLSKAQKVNEVGDDISQFKEEVVNEVGSEAPISKEVVVDKVGDASLSGEEIKKKVGNASLSESEQEMVNNVANISPSNQKILNEIGDVSLFEEQKVVDDVGDHLSLSKSLVPNNVSDDLPHNDEQVLSNVENEDDLDEGSKSEINTENEDKLEECETIISEDEDGLAELHAELELQANNAEHSMNKIINKLRKKTQKIASLKRHIEELTKETAEVTRMYTQAQIVNKSLTEEAADIKNTMTAVCDMVVSNVEAESRVQRLESLCYRRYTNITCQTDAQNVLASIRSRQKALSDLELMVYRKQLVLSHSLPCQLDTAKVNTKKTRTPIKATKRKMTDDDESSTASTGGRSVTIEIVPASPETSSKEPEKPAPRWKTATSTAVKTATSATVKPTLPVSLSTLMDSHAALYGPWPMPFAAGAGRERSIAADIVSLIETLPDSRDATPTLSFTPSNDDPDIE